MAHPDAPSEPSRQGWRSLRAVLTVQTLNAFNDNVVRFALLGIALVVLQGQRVPFLSAELEWKDIYKNLIGTLISLPFVLFAPIAGWASDRFSKKTVIRACLYAQIAIVVAIMGAIMIGDLWLATAGFFVLAIQSAFFGPAKLGIVKELVGSSKLAVASGWMQMLTIMAIVFGAPAGGGGYKAARNAIVDDPWLAGLVPVGCIGVFAVLALAILRRIQPTPVHHGEPLTIGVFFRHFVDLGELYRSRPVWLSSLGIAFFFFSGAFAIAVLTQIAQEHYTGDTAASVASYFMATTGLGIGLGSIFVALVSSQRIELGLVALGGFGMALSMFLATLFAPSQAAFYVTLGLLGASSAMFLVPQTAYLQDKADPGRRGRVLSASNLINSTAAISANVIQATLQLSGISSRIQLWLLGIVSLAAAAYSLQLLPSNFARILVKMALRTFYRLRIKGEPNLPESGGALLLSNHVTWIDGLLIGAASSRDVRFAAHEDLFRRRLVGWGLRLFGVIPISSNSAREAIRATADAIREGALVCIFPEGTRTRTGTLNELHKGFELIVRQSGGAPVLPVYLDRLWGSIFSFSGNRFLFKIPRKLPYPATVNFGAPIPAEQATRVRVRDALVALSLQAYRQRPELHTTLDDACIDALKRRGRKVCLVDRSAKRSMRLTRSAILASSLQLGQRWRETIADPCVAIALPPSSPGVLAHLGLIFAGKTIVNLPLETNAARCQKLAEALREAAVGTVITTEAIGQGRPTLPWPERVIHLADELRAVDGLPRLWSRVHTALSPRWWLRTRGRRSLASANGVEEPAVGVWTPQGHYQFISHREILTQVAQISDANAFHPEDRFLNTYSYDQIPGQLFGLWLPLLRHQRLVVHTMGSHPPSPDALLNGEGVTVLVTDGAGLQACEPALGTSGSVVRMIATFGPWRGDDSFCQTTLRHPHATVCRGLISEGHGMLLSLSIPHPDFDRVKQPGHKQRASGRVLPGMHLRCEGTEDHPGALLAQSPGSNLDSMVRLEIQGYIDPEGFLFPVPHDLEN